VDQITFEGTVPDTFSNQNEFRMKIAEKDVNRVITFIGTTDTTYRTGGFPVRNKRHVSECKAGDYIEITIEKQIRKDKMRLLTTGLKKLNLA